MRQRLQVMRQRTVLVNLQTNLVTRQRLQYLFIAFMDEGPAA